MNKEVRAIVEEVLENDFSLSGSNGYYETEIHANETDVMEKEVIEDILLNEYPRDRFNELMFEWYTDADADVITKYVNKILDKLEETNIELDITEEELEDDIKEMVNALYPYDHYENQKIRAKILMDTETCVIETTFGDLLDSVEDKTSVIAAIVD